jgi:hypothetical protein
VIGQLEGEDYKCQNEEYSKGLCKFHLEEYATKEENKKELAELLKKKVEEANASGLPLKCIGYHFPADIPIANDFKVDVYFDYANFIGDVDFSDSVFESGVSFHQATFNGQASFREASFKGFSIFTSAIFNREAHFAGAIFGIAAYLAATYNGEVSFFGTAFYGITRFSRSKFNGKADFSYAGFNGEAEFDLSHEPVIGYLIFSYVSLKEQEKILFNGDLSKVSFANTDITRVRFGDKVVWGKRERNPGNSKSEKDDSNEIAKQKIDFKIYDERLIELESREKDKSSANSLEAVIAEYRNLRENYEYHLRYEEAGQFFIREMELRRIYEQKSSPTGENRIKKRTPSDKYSTFQLYTMLFLSMGNPLAYPLLLPHLHLP